LLRVFQKKEKGQRLKPVTFIIFTARLKPGP
jgi:hypothetical protein